MNSAIAPKKRRLRHLPIFAAVAGIFILVFVGDSAVLPIANSGMLSASKNEVSDGYFGMTVIGAKLSPQAHFGSLRTWNAQGVAWPEMNPALNVYSWSSLDRIADRAQNLGYDVLYTFGRTPRWASSDPNAPMPGYGLGECAPPSSIHYWDDFVRAIVLRASGRIKYWEIWNEPQESPPRGYYCGDIPTMVKLQQHAYEIIKSIDPSAMVLTPSAAGGVGPRWMAKFLDAGGGRYADIMAFHGYADKKAESVLPVINNFARVFAAYGQGSKPMWNTEAGWGENRWFSDPDLQAAFLAQFYLLQWSAGVERFYWYAYDEPEWGTLWDRINGLRKAGVAYNEVRRWMVGATMDRPCAVNAGVWICNFSRPNGYHAIAAWDSTGDSSFIVEGNYKRYRDLTGKTTKISNHNVPISNLPVLVETEPFILE
jgi:hypothetical protein